MITTLRKGSHIVSRLTCHIVWSTKYRYKVLRGDVQIRCRELLRQVSEAYEIEILKGRSSLKLQMEFPKLKERYWGRHFWATGYGAWSSDNITDKMVNDYLEHHRKPEDSGEDVFILE